MRLDATRWIALAATALLWMPASVAAAQTAEQYREDALSIEGLLAERYAYLDRFSGGTVPVSLKLRAEAASVSDRRGLVRYAERALLSLADHHAITGASLPDSWAVVPSYADLWVVADDEGYVIDAVREGSPAAAAGILSGDRLVAVDDLPIAKAIKAFWSDLGGDLTPERAAYAARVLAAGRRDRVRRLAVSTDGGLPRAVTLRNLYEPRSDVPRVTVQGDAASLVIKFGDSLGNSDTITDFDAALAGAAMHQPVVIDLTETPGGGNTVVARAIMGWFVDRPQGYQVHSLPAEERETGIGRRWIEQVLPRSGKYHNGPVTVRVGRWTGSMGEGLAIGFHALGARVEGHRMAGLLGAISDVRLMHSGLVLKIPTERLETVAGLPRETFVPIPQDPTP